MKPAILFISFILFFAKIATCQTKDIYLIAGGGYSLNGTGDMPGYNILNEVDIQLNKHFFLSPGIQFTNNATTEELTGYKLNYVAAGLNIFTNIQYLLLNKGHHRIAIGAGPVIRFENSSVPNDVSVSGRPPSNDYILSITYGKLHTTSLGYNVSPSYYYQCGRKMSIGAKFIFQNDTRGDVITSALAFVGVKL